MGTTPGIPVLETGRLRLRPFTPADADAVHALAGAREVAETTLNLPHPYPPGAAAAWIETHRQLATAGEAFTWAIVRRDDDRLMGALVLEMNARHRCPLPRI